MGAAENRISSKVVVIRDKVDDAIASIADATEGWREQVEAKLREAASVLEEAANAIAEGGSETPPEEPAPEAPAA